MAGASPLRDQDQGRLLPANASSEAYMSSLPRADLGAKAQLEDRMACV